MPLTKRIIACLDVQNGRTVKGIHFENLKDQGDPVEQAAYYAQQGVDELVFLDISATHEKRKTLSALVNAVAKKINIPFTVGGGIASIDDVKRLLDNGADKVSINTAAVQNPDQITALAQRFGSQCIVLAVDTQYKNNDWWVFTHGGKKPTHLKAIEWIKTAENLGAGELLLTSMDKDGTLSGFDLPLLYTVNATVHIPVIASGGAGSMEHFKDVFTHTSVDAALAASIFHDRTIDLPLLKAYLHQQHIPVRL